MRADTIVPPEDQISEFEARRQLSRVLRALGEIEGAEAEIRKLLKSGHEVPALLADLADLEAVRGHFLESRKLYEQALSRNPKSIEMRYALQARSWGHFYFAEKVLRARLQEHPLDIEARLALAGVLDAEQRYEEAEQEYHAVLEKPVSRKRPLIGLANNRFLARDYEAVLPFVDRVLKSHPNQIEALTLRADSLRALRKYDEAKETYRRLTMLPEGRVSGWIGLARIAQLEKDNTTAQSCFQRAQSSVPGDVTPRYLLAAAHAGRNASLLQQLLSWQNLPVAQLDTLAGLCASDGYFDFAITIYQAVLARDSKYFPAQIGLAQVLASDRRYDESIELLTELRREFPDNAKVILLLARVLSWSRQYDESLRIYGELSSLNPEDPVPRIEMARVAAWNKQMNLAHKVYAEIYTPAVDELLAQALGSHAWAALGRIGSNKKGPPYRTYEQLQQLVDSGELPTDSRPEVKAALEDLLPSYRIQKAAWLESRAKWFSWNKRFIHSQKTYQELLNFQPGNEEARFDLAQVQAAQGLSLESTATYRQLLELDPMHSLAGEALERQRINQSPAIFTEYTYWDEKGIGRASDMQRQSLRSGIELVWNGQTHFRFSGDYWLESPGSAANAGAAGVTVGMRTVFNEYWRASGEWSHKEYFNTRYEPTDTGNLSVAFNAWDYVHLSLQYARLDELHNEFGLSQGVQSDNVSLLFDSAINHYIELRGGATWTHYTDGNDGVWLTVAPSFILHDHPQTLKLVFRGDYRNTAEESIFEFEGSTLVNIIHPYWTPQHYTRGTVILEWRHDLSRAFYAGAQRLYYALRAGTGIDSTENVNFLIEAEWHYEFLRHWILEARGGVDRSPAWDGAAAFVSMTYRF